MLNVAQSMKKCSSSDNFPTTPSLLRSFLNKNTTTFRHFAAVVHADEHRDMVTSHISKVIVSSSLAVPDSLPLFV